MRKIHLPSLVVVWEMAQLRAVGQDLDDGESRIRKDVDSCPAPVLTQEEDRRGETEEDEERDGDSHGITPAFSMAEARPDAMPTR